MWQLDDVPTRIGIPGNNVCRLLYFTIFLPSNKLNSVKFGLLNIKLHREMFSKMQIEWCIVPSKKAFVFQLHVLY